MNDKYTQIFKTIGTIIDIIIAVKTIAESSKK